MRGESLLNPHSFMSARESHDVNADTGQSSR